MVTLDASLPRVAGLHFAGYSRRMTPIGTRIKRRREQLGLTQEAVAEACHVSRPLVAQWEANKKPPGGQRLRKLASMLQVSVDWLLTGNGFTDHAANDTFQPGVSVQRWVVPMLTKNQLVLRDKNTNPNNIVETLQKFSDDAFAVAMWDDSNDSGADGGLSRGSLCTFDPAIECAPGKIVIAYRNATDIVVGRLSQEATAAGLVTIITPLNNAWPATRSDQYEIEVIGPLVQHTRLFQA